MRAGEAVSRKFVCRAQLPGAPSFAPPDRESAGMGATHDGGAANRIIARGVDASRDDHTRVLVQSLSPHSGPLCCRQCLLASPTCCYTVVRRAFLALLQPTLDTDPCTVVLLR